MAKNIIESPGWAPTVDGVESDIDSMGRGNATSIEGHTVLISYSPEEVSGLSSGTKFDISPPQE